MKSTVLAMAMALVFAPLPASAQDEVIGTQTFQSQRVQEFVTAFENWEETKTLRELGQNIYRTGSHAEVMELLTFVGTRPIHMNIDNREYLLYDAQMILGANPNTQAANPALDLHRLHKEFYTEMFSRGNPTRHTVLMFAGMITGNANLGEKLQVGTLLRIWRNDPSTTVATRDLRLSYFVDAGNNSLFDALGQFNNLLIGLSVMSDIPMTEIMNAFFGSAEMTGDVPLETLREVTQAVIQLRDPHYGESGAERILAAQLLSYIHAVPEVRSVGIQPGQAGYPWWSVTDLFGQVFQETISPEDAAAILSLASQLEVKEVAETLFGVQGYYFPEIKEAGFRGIQHAPLALFEQILEVTRVATLSGSDNATPMRKLIRDVLTDNGLLPKAGSGLHISDTNVGQYSPELFLQMIWHHQALLPYSEEVYFRARAMARSLSKFVQDDVWRKKLLTEFVKMANETNNPDMLIPLYKASGAGDTWGVSAMILRSTEAVQNIVDIYENLEMSDDAKKVVESFLYGALEGRPDVAALAIEVMPKLTGEPQIEPVAALEKYKSNNYDWVRGDHWQAIVEAGKNAKPQQNLIHGTATVDWAKVIRLQIEAANRKALKR